MIKKKLKKKIRQDQPVLAAVDFSQDSEVAITWASRYAAAVDAPLLLLHVVHDQRAGMDGHFVASIDRILQIQGLIIYLGRSPSDEHKSVARC